jgi:hypothetical protein
MSVIEEAPRLGVELDRIHELVTMSAVKALVTLGDRM